MDKRQLFLGVLVLVLLVVVRLKWDPYPMQEMRLMYFDALQQISPREHQETPVRVVDIDEKSLREIGQWPWPRDIVADMVESLAANGAAVVAFDVLFSEPDRYSPASLVGRSSLASVGLPDGVKNALQDVDFDVDLANAFYDVPVVLGIARGTEENDFHEAAIVEVIEFGDGLIDALPPLVETTPIVPVLRDAAAGIGSINTDPGRDASIVRTVPLLWQTPAGAMPSFAVETLRVAFAEQSMILFEAEGSAGIIDAVGLGQVDIPTSRDGQMWMRFRENDAHPDLYVSAVDVINNPGTDPDLRAKLDGHVVLVGTSAAGLYDIRTTALGETVPGVSIHAQIIEQIFTGTFLTRADWTNGAEVLVLIAMGLLVGHRMLRSGPLMSFATGFGCAVITAAGSWVAFANYNLLIDASFPLVGGFLAFSIVAGYQFIVADRDKRELRRSFSRYVAPTVLQKIEESGYALELGGEMRQMTVMFCDIRDFTPISERYTATELVSFLNTLFDRLSAQILGAQGTIDKFIGDNIMAFWNAPVPVEDHPGQAMQAALGMRHALTKFNSERDDPPVRVAIGIATGEVCVGNIGSADRFDYSVIGDNVNVTARLESACREVGCDILVANATHTDPTKFACLYAGALELKGVSAAVPAWVLVGDAKVAAKSAFRDAERLLDDWMHALRAGASAQELQDRQQLLREAVEVLDPALTDFVERLPSRLEQYQGVKRAA